ncbi:tRNA methyltransferase 10 homolog A [Halyomorpha halys]|uniref:tRNA methyltransferase 10 homolog A n=1 Tax=Halyomorpha halys TaxID=286706 RepID=UPI0006D5061D|nr:tRNA methyltransferase 10 homolog A [Halyomorpha halys]XP_014274836.1 tRNA methyltransferase 10 homolog A [Halyomorpha halys]XP_014274837.1 tRNA methyltransferase 10 homolog A [Halyomorpha halys]
MPEEIQNCEVVINEKIADDGEEKEDVQQVPIELSKRARKRLLRKEKWLEYKPIKRAKERAKIKKRKEEAKLNNIKLGPTRKELKQHKMSLSSCKVRVVLDFSFDDLMNEKDLHKCINQFSHCYALNRRCSNPLQLHVVNFRGKAKDTIQKNNGYNNWDVNFHSEDYCDVFKKDELVYLTSDSENIIDSLDSSKAYIIGALVDHNSQKGLCLKIATERNISHGRLPIDEFVQMKTRQVLTIDHVFDILLNVAAGGLSWKDAFMKVIPQRKGICPKSSSEPSSI